MNIFFNLYYYFSYLWETFCHFWYNTRRIPDNTKTVYLDLDTSSQNSGGLFGLELTFTNTTFVELGREDKEPEYREEYVFTFKAWLAAIARVCPDAKITQEPFPLDEYDYEMATIILPSGIEFYLHSDDWVFEVGSSPISAKMYERHLPTIQAVIFDTSQEVGLEVHARIGGGHLHLDKPSHFHGDVLLFRNFVIDLLNRPELFLGGFSLDLLNAPPLSILPLPQHETFIQLLNEFDALPESQQTIDRFSKPINEKVYYKSYIQSKSSQLQCEFNKEQKKYHAVNLLHQHTLEIRGLHPQRNAHVVLTQMRLFESRIASLRPLSSSKARIPYQPQFLADVVGWQTERNMEFYEVQLPPSLIQRTVLEYIKEAYPDKEKATIVEIFDEVVTEALKSCVRNGGKTVYTVFPTLNGFGATFLKERGHPNGSCE